MVTTLASTYFGSSQLGHITKANCIKFESNDLEIIHYLENHFGQVSPLHVAYDF